MEQTISEKYHISSKPGKAKAIAQHIEEIPHFIKDIADKLLIIELLGQN
jgi:putative ATP-dependent endonuclease of OLD family